MIDTKLYKLGYEHGYESNVLDDPSLHFKKSFREGFRQAKIEIRQHYRKHGVIPISSKQNLKLKFKNKM